MGVVGGCDVVWYGRGCNVGDVVWYELYKVVGVMSYHMNGTRVHIIRMIWIVQGVRVMALVSHICVMSHVSHICVMSHVSHIYVMSHVSQICVTHGSHICDIARTPDTRDMICCTTWMMQMTWHVVQHEWCKCHLYHSCCHVPRVSRTPDTRDMTTWMIQMLYNMNDTNVEWHLWHDSCQTWVRCVMSHTHVWCLTHMCDVAHTCVMSHVSQVWVMSHVSPICVCDVTRFTHMCVWCHTFHPYVCVKHMCETCDITHVTSHSVITGHVTRVTHVCGVTRFTHMCGVSLLVQGVWVTSHICVTKDTYTHTYVWCHTYVWQKIHTITNMCDVTRFTRMCATRVRVEHTRTCETCAHICVVSHYWYKERESRHTYVWQKIHTLTHMSHICVALVTFKEHNIARLRFICVTCHIKSSSSRCVSHVWHVWRKIRHVWQEIHNTLMCDNRQQIRHVWQQIHNTLPLNRPSLSHSLSSELQSLHSLSQWVSVSHSLLRVRICVHMSCVLRDTHSQWVSVSHSPLRVRICVHMSCVLRDTHSQWVSVSHSPLRVRICVHMSCVWSDTHSQWVSVMTLNLSEWVALTLHWEWVSIYTCGVSWVTLTLREWVSWEWVSWEWVSWHSLPVSECHSLFIESEYAYTHMVYLGWHSLSVSECHSLSMESENIVYFGWEMMYHVWHMSHI